MLAARDGIRIGHVSLADAARAGQQLFFAVGGMFHQEGQGKRPYVKKTVPPDMRLLRPVAHRQLVLLDCPRDLRAGLRLGFPPPPDPALEAAFDQFVREHAARYGWTAGKAERIQRAIRIMLGIQDTPGAAIRRSDVALLSQDQVLGRRRRRCAGRGRDAGGGPRARRGALVPRGDRGPARPDAA